jgi:hypothetical protein
VKIKQERHGRTKRSDWASSRAFVEGRKQRILREFAKNLLRVIEEKI